MTIAADLDRLEITLPLDEWASTAKASALADLRPWWALRVERAGLPAAWGELETALDARPPEPLPHANGAALPADAHALGLAYVETLPAEERSAHGRHYTPRHLAEHLWGMTRRALGFGVDPQRLPGLVRDPAVGAAALLVPALREHLTASVDVDPALTLASLAQHLEGIDTDPWAVYVANVVLAAEMLPTLARVPETRRRSLPALARVGDGLAADLPPACAWVMNPPYGRQRLTPEVREQFADVLYGHANLYGLFMAAALRGVTHDGVVAALVPTSFSAGLYSTRLRERLGERAPLRALAFVHDRSGVFGGVLQETCLATFTPRPAEHVEISRIDGTLLDVAEVPVPRTSSPWLLPREPVDAALAATASMMPLTLREAGWHASTGPLVWNRRRADLRAHPCEGSVPVVWAGDIDGGTLHRERARDPFRHITLRDETDVLVNTLTDPAVLVQRTTAPEQVRRLVVLDLTREHLDALGGRVVVENHLNVLRPSVASPLLTRATLARVLASPTLDRLIRCFSGSIAVSSYELGALPLPAPEVLMGWESLEGDALDAAVAEAYGPTLEDRP